MSSGRSVVAVAHWMASPDHDFLDTPDAVFEFELPTGKFFDGAFVHILTTTTLDRFHSTSAREPPGFTTVPTQAYY